MLRWGEEEEHTHTHTYACVYTIYIYIYMARAAHVQSLQFAQVSELFGNRARQSIVAQNPM